jgi:asparagine synthase (glutamine-hydrolysing)
MCGLTGFYIDEHQFDRNFLLQNLNKMNDAQLHRGPDSKNIWLNEENTVGLGHVRLSIRDLSPNGNQPMKSSCGRYTITYNGEIYNVDENKIDIENKGIKLKSTSDTEILVELISIYGVENTLSRINGMFAFVVWDNKEKSIYLVRDRMGIKPLHYFFSKNDNVLVFGSEIKSITQNFLIRKEINIKALNSFLMFGFNKNNETIYKSINQVKPGEIIKITKNFNKIHDQYWSVGIKSFKTNKNKSNLEEAEIELEELIKDAIKLRTISDVPIGTFLSGGTDSSLVTSLLCEINKTKVKTFSVGFAEKEYDESKDAKKIANYLDTEHHEIFIGEKELLFFFDNLYKIYDEPFADSSQIPTAIISSYAKKNVGVILSGDGGDELFGGYNRYLDCENFIKKKNLSTFIKRNIAKFIKSSPQSLVKLIEVFSKKNNLIYKCKEYLKSFETNNLYNNFLAQWRSLDEVLSHEFIDYEAINNFNSSADYNFDFYMCQDINEYLPNDILAKVDRASMFSSLEVRVPLLDYRIVNFATKLPNKFKINNNEQKIILKNILKKKLPTHLMKKNKMGFGIPIDEWLRTFLKERVDFLLSDENLKKNQFLSNSLIKGLWNDHKNYKGNYGLKLWNIIIFQQWFYNKMISKYD